MTKKPIINTVIGCPSDQAIEAVEILRKAHIPAFLVFPKADMSQLKRNYLKTSTPDSKTTPHKGRAHDEYVQHDI